MKRYFIFIFLLGATILMRAQDTFLWANADSKEAERRYNEIYGIGGEGYERNQRIQQYNKELYVTECITHFHWMNRNFLKKVKIL